MDYSPGLLTPGTRRTANSTRHTPRALVRLVAVVIALLVALPASASAASAAPAEPTERVVITFAGGTAASERATALADAVSEPLVSAAAVSSPITTATVTATERAALEASATVAAVEDDVVATADRIAVDPGYAAADGLRKIHADTAWDTTTGASGTVVAVIDTGVDQANTDLEGKLVAGYDFVNGDAVADDDNGHGTAVASIAAAASNTYGIPGVCWDCRVMPIKALGADGSGYLSDAARGIVWAVDHGADVINMSLSGTSQLFAMNSALVYAEDNGVLVVASAGNDATTQQYWPAADERALSVAATDGDRRASYSNHGDWIDVAAPGCNPADTPGSGTRTFCGTSSSAPLVSGVAALARSLDPALSGADLRAILTDTARPLAADLGAGNVDAAAVVAAVPGYTADPQPHTQPVDGDPVADPYADGPAQEPTQEPTQEPQPETTPSPAPAQSPTPGFSDVAGNTHTDNIAVLAASGITTGCTADRYCPGKTVTRAQIATFLTRGLDLPAGTASFSDVPTGYAHAKGIAAVAAAGITKGCAPGRFCPNAGLTRGQMASLLARALDLHAGDATFSDVPASHPHAAGIAALAKAGITTGCGADRFCPDSTVNRAQLASFLVRALDL